jgi:nitroreductase
MDVRDALRRRHMTRAFDGTEVPEDRLATLCVDALRAPTAGHARGVETVVLAGAAGVRRYLEAATDAAWRASSARAAGFARAGGAVVVVCAPDAYTARYAADDKAEAGLADAAAWPVPYWFGDAAFATMALLLLAEEDGLAACFLGAFRHEADVLAAVDAPPGRRVFGAVLLGQPSPDQRRSRSLELPGPARVDRVVRGGFTPG